MSTINLAELNTESLRLLLEAAEREQQLRDQEERNEAILSIQKLMRKYAITEDELSKSVKLRKRNKNESIVTLGDDVQAQNVVTPIVAEPAATTDVVAPQQNSLFE